MMDWNKIQEQYPNGLKELNKTMFPNIGMVSISMYNHLDIKKLYNFFDKKGIFLTVEMLTKNSWVFMISLSNGVVISPQQESKPNRELSELNGFYECFKILEKKINKKSR